MTIVRTETGIEYDQPNLRLQWSLKAVENAADGEIILRPHAQLAKVAAACRADVNVDTVLSPSTIDGWVTLSGDIIWLTAQTDPDENGIYIKSRVGRSLTKSPSLTDLIGSGKPIHVKVLGGTVHKNKFYRFSADDGITPMPDPGLNWLTADLDDYRLDSDTCDADAFDRGHDAGMAKLMLGRRQRYNFARTLYTKRKMHVQGLATAHLRNNTEMQFAAGCGNGIHALFGDTTPDTQGGWTTFSNLWLRYMGSYLEENDYHGMVWDTPCSGNSLTIQDFPGHGLHSATDLAFHTGANLCRGYDIEIYQSGLSGVYVAGADANASYFAAINAMACGKRKKDCVRAQYLMRLTNSTGTDKTIAVGRQVWKDSRYGLFYMSRDVGTGVIPAMGSLDITIEAYDRTLESEIIGAGVVAFLGTGTQFGWGTEYNQPLANTINMLVYADEDLTGVTATNPSGPSVTATLGDAHGIWDNAFLGNTWIGCHSTAPGVRHYLCRKSGGTIFVGCYTETGNFGELTPPNLTMGGLWGDPPGMQSPGWVRDTSSSRLSPFIVFTQGPNDVCVRIAPDKTDEVFRITSKGDTGQGLRLFGETAGGRLDNCYSFMHSGQQILGFTKPADQRGVGHAVLPRGAVLGNPGGRFTFITALPAQSTSTDVWNVGDAVFVMSAASGNGWLYRCTAKVFVSGTTYNLTWTAALNAP